MTYSNTQMPSRLTDPVHIALRAVIAALVTEQRAYEEARVQAILTEQAA